MRSLLWGIGLMATSLSAAPLELHVAVDGRDDQPGTAAKPLATLTAARDRLREAKPADGAVVLIHLGDYLLTEPLELTAEDSAPDGQRIVYRAAGDGEVRFHGGVEISGFEPYRDGILKADVKALGLPHTLADSPTGGKTSRYAGNVPGFELFFGGERMTLARWPNKIPGDQRWGEWAYLPPVTAKTKDFFPYVGDRPEHWAKPQEAQVHWFPWYNYMDQYTGIMAIDRERKVIEVSPPAVYDIQPGRRHYFRNVFEELDAPGEWYYDRDAEVLYFYPTEPLAGRPVVASRLGTAFVIDGASNVTLQGLTIESCNGDGVAIRSGAHNLVAGCEIRNVFRDGVQLTGGTDNRVLSCDIHDVGMRGILLGGGDRETLTDARNAALNNHIHHLSCVVHTYSPGVQLTGCGNLVSHNRIHDGPHMILGLAGNNHVIEYNEVHHAMHISSHGGAFYCGRDYTARGNVIRYNSFHDINGYGFDHVDHERGVYVYRTPVKSLPGAFGIHLDDQISGFQIHHNVFYRLGHGVVRLGGGRDTVIENNIFYDAGWAVHIDNRGMGWQRESNTKGTLGQRLRATPYQQPPWSTRYPELVDIVEDRLGEPVDNVVRRNIFYQRDTLYNISRVPADRFLCDDNVMFRDNGELQLMGRTFKPNAGGLITLPEWQQMGFDTRSVNADPKLTDPAHDDYTPQPDSPVWKLGFTAIPIDQIGLYQDDYRTGPLPPHDPRRDSSEGVIEEYPIPGWQPPEVVEPTELAVPQARLEVTVDGKLEAREYGQPDEAWAMVVDYQGNPVKYPSQAWVTHDGEALYVAIRSQVDPKQALSKDAVWGQSDAVEVALQDVSGAKPGPVFVVRGYPNGEWLSSPAAGAPADLVKRVGQAASYAATSSAPGVWEAEWRLPLDALGVAPPRPAAEPSLRFNVTVHKACSREWAMWRASRGDSTNVQHTGVIRLTLPHGG